jgi:hypothetical protein
MSNTVLTRQGLDFVTSAGDLGVLVAVKYCIPVYDYRLDTDIHDNIHTSAISYESTLAATSASSYPIGERIFLTSGSTDYNLSQQYILSGSSTIATSGSNTKVTSCPQSKIGIGQNLYQGVPLSNSISATTIYPPSTNDFWLVDSATSADVVGVNPISASDRSKFFQCGDYFPVVDGNGNVTGSFIAHISQSVGRFKFNKVAFYCVSMLNDQEVLTTPPVFFAECFVKECCVKSNIADQGFDDFVVHASIDLTPLNAYGTSAYWFSTSADYWSRTVGGLYSPDPIGIGSFQGSVTQPDASLHVRPTTVNPDLHLMRLDGSDNSTTYLDVVSGGLTSGSFLSASCKGFLVETLGKYQSEIEDAYIDTAVIDTIDLNHLSASATHINVHKDLEIGANIYPDGPTPLRNIGEANKQFLNVYTSAVNAVNIIGTSGTISNIFTSAITGNGSFGITLDSGDAMSRLVFQGGLDPATHLTDPIQLGAIYFNDEGSYYSIRVSKGT